MVLVVDKKKIPLAFANDYGSISSAETSPGFHPSLSSDCSSDLIPDAPQPMQAYVMPRDAGVHGVVSG